MDSQFKSLVATVIASQIESSIADVNKKKKRKCMILFGDVHG